MNTKFAVALILALGAIGHAQAQTSTTASATQQSAATSTAQGTIQFSQEPEHTSQTIRNVSGPVLGAYAASFSQLNCGQTAQLGAAVAGFSIAAGASKDSHSCVLEVASAESTRQSTVTEDPVVKAALQSAAIAIRCQVSEEVYRAYVASGLDCKGMKPKGIESREDSQPANYRVAGN